MTQKVYDYGMVPIFELTKSGIKGMKLRVYCVFSLYRGNWREPMWVSKEEVARRMGRTPKALQPHIKGLVDAGWLSRADPGEEGPTAMYCVNRDKGELR